MQSSIVYTLGVGLKLTLAYTGYFFHQGDYSFEREPVEWTFPNFPIFPYGHYRLTLLGGPKGYNDGTGCVIAEAHVIPKPH